MTTHHPDEHYSKRLKLAGITPPKSQLLSSKHLPNQEVAYWGATPSLSHWCKKKGKRLHAPEPLCVKEVTSKAFSYLNSPRLEGSELLHSYEQAQAWIEKTPPPAVLKTLFGLSGRGHCLLDNGLDSKVDAFLCKTLARGEPVIAEPWMPRVLDFSTQWFIHQEREIEYIGSTVCHNDEAGCYKKTVIYPDDSIGSEYRHFLMQHKTEAVKILRIVQDKGFYGHVGIDSMLYINKGEVHLHPILEINARKTMGWVALQLQRKYCPHDILTMSYDSAAEQNNLLPNYVIAENGKITTFPKSLYCSRVLQK